VAARYIVPQVNVYAGEGFDEVAESFFGFMERDGEQQGRPYEPRTVRMKSDLRGAASRAAAGLPARRRRRLVGKVDAPVPARGRQLQHGGDEQGVDRHDRPLDPRRRFLTVGDLVARWGVAEPYHGQAFDGPVTYLGIERPEGLPAGSDAITLDRLAELVPG
jgi:hypothetical protein